MISIIKNLYNRFKTEFVYYNSLLTIFLLIAIGIYFSVSIFYNAYNGDFAKIDAEDVLAFLGSLLTVYASVSSTFTYMKNIIENRILLDLLSEKIFELVSHSPIFNYKSINDFFQNNGSRSIAFSLFSRLKVDLLEQREDFSFNYNQTQTVLIQIKKKLKLSDLDIYVLSFFFYENRYWDWDSYIHDFKKVFVNNKEFGYKTIKKYFSEKYNNPTDLDLLVTDFVKSSMGSTESKYEKIIEADTTLSDSELFQHILSNTYVQADYNPSIDIKKHKGPVLLIKNEEKFTSWWQDVDKIIGPKLLKEGIISKEEAENFSTRDHLENKKKGSTTQPFFTAIKESPIIYNYLEFLKQSPVFYFDTRDIPPEFNSNPNLYINRYLKPMAKKRFETIVNHIKQVYSIKSVPKKPLIMNYQLIPFNTEKMVIKIDSENYPKPIQRLIVSSMLSYDQKKKLIRSHIIETKKFIEDVSPFSLVSTSVPSALKEELRKSEKVILKELFLKKNGQIVFRGIEQILSNEVNLPVIESIIHNKLKLLKIKIKKSELKSALLEILNNAKRIKEKIS